MLVLGLAIDRDRYINTPMLPICKCGTTEFVDTNLLLTLAGEFGEKLTVERFLLQTLSLSSHRCLNLILGINCCLKIRLWPLWWLIEESFSCFKRNIQAFTEILPFLFPSLKWSQLSHLQLPKWVGLDIVQSMELAFKRFCLMHTQRNSTMRGKMYDVTKPQAPIYSCCFTGPGDSSPLCQRKVPWTPSSFKVMLVGFVWFLFFLIRTCLLFQ